MTRHLLSIALALAVLLLPVELRARTDMSASMISAWELESNCNDSAGSNNLTVNNAPSFVAAKQGNGADLELSASQDCSLADNASLSLSTDTDFTISVWLRIESNLTDQFAIAKSGDYGVKYQSGNLYVYAIDGTAFEAKASAGAVSIATWYHICGGHDATGNTVWVRQNGAATVTDATNPNGTKDGAGDFRIGSNSTANYFDGIIDQAIFWKRKLSSAECDELYNSGAGVTLASITGGGGGSTPCLRMIFGLGCDDQPAWTRRRH